jgi:signal transduction histidine kinase
VFARCPSGADAAAYRIVQEALTNVARHAGSATATVRVNYGEHDLTVQVDSDGRGPPPGSGQPAATESTACGNG